MPLEVWFLSADNVAAAERADEPDKTCWNVPVTERAGGMKLGGSIWVVAVSSKAEVFSRGESEAFVVSALLRARAAMESRVSNS